MVSPGFVNQLLDEHDRGRRDHCHRLWSLLMLELWFREADQPALRRRDVALALTA